MSKARPLSDLSTTLRGFGLVKFEDCGGVRCNLQESSLATQAAIWLGVADVKAEVLWSDAAAVGVRTEATSGWVPFTIPREVLISTRMHLGCDQVKRLITKLRSWARDGRGRLPTIKFDDLYNGHCILRRCTVADCGPSIMLGVVDVDPQIMWRDAAGVGIPTTATCGWVKYPVPPQVKFYSCMVLDRERVLSLVAHLKAWLKTGSVAYGG